MLLTRPASTGCSIRHKALPHFSFPISHSFFFFSSNTPGSSGPPTLDTDLGMSLFFCCLASIHNSHAQRTTPSKHGFVKHKALCLTLFKVYVCVFVLLSNLVPCFCTVSYCLSVCLCLFFPPRNCPFFRYFALPSRHIKFICLSLSRSLLLSLA